MDEMIFMIWQFILWIFFVWKVYFRLWWIGDEYRCDSHKVLQYLVYFWQVWISNWLLDWFTLTLVSWSLLHELSSLFLDLSMFGMLILIIKLRDWIRSTVVKSAWVFLRERLEHKLVSWKMKKNFSRRLLLRF